MDQERLDFLAQIAVWYYEERLDQETIAGRINKSRSMVSRLLDQAREAGLVEVKVLYPCAPMLSWSGGCALNSGWRARRCWPSRRTTTHCS